MCRADQGSSRTPAPRPISTFRLTSWRPPTPAPRRSAISPVTARVRSTAAPTIWPARRRWRRCAPWSPGMRDKRGYQIAEIPLPTTGCGLARQAARDPSHPMAPFLPLFVGQGGGRPARWPEMYASQVFPRLHQGRAQIPSTHAARQRHRRFLPVGGELLDRNMLDRLMQTGLPACFRRSVGTCSSIAGTLAPNNYPDWESFRFPVGPADADPGECWPEQCGPGSAAPKA